MVLVTRADLNLSRGKLAAQCGHAVAECILKAKRDDPRMLKRYTGAGARKIVCEAPDLDSLKRLYGDARMCGLVCYMVTDAGHTEDPCRDKYGSWDRSRTPFRNRPTDKRFAASEVNK